MMNKFLLLGKIYKESEISTTESGLSIGTIYVSTRERFKDKETHHKLSIIGDGAFCESLKIGDIVTIDGKLSSHEWYNKAGKPQISNRLMVSTYSKINAD